MFDIDRFQEIWVTISRNKARSILTGFGVFWGIFMLIVMLGSGQGLQNGIMKNIDGFATNSCFFYTSATGEPYKGFRKGRHWNIRNRDIEAIQQSVPELAHISPMLWGRGGTDNVVYNDKAGSFSVRGLYPSYTEIEQQRIKTGRFVNEVDIRQKRKVCVIGTTVYDEIFSQNEDPIGKYIRVNGIYYQVVGVSSGISQISIGGRSDEAVVIPFTTMQQINNQGDIVHMMGATAKKGVKVEVLEEHIKQVLKSQNKISPTDMQAVGSFNIEKQFLMFDYLFIGISLVIWIVGVGTLLAGVIGVSNIMLVTVKERTKEIGIRRALGAKPLTILRQIMSESFLLTSMAGIMGLCAGVGLLIALDSGLEANAAENNTFFAEPIIPFFVAVSAMVILLVCSLIAGAIPAWRALQIKAIDAIREE